MTGRALATLLCFMTVAGCCKDEANPVPAQPARPATTAAPEAPATAATATSTGAETPKPAQLPPGRSAVPTLDEWNAMRKEVTVKGSSALGCETKMVREYLRVSCRGKNDTGGTPTTVRVVKGGRGQPLTFASGGTTSLVVPYVEGIGMRVEFSWTDKSHPLALNWPRGSRMPVILGTFEGAASPLDRPAGGIQAKLCECYKKLSGASACGDMMAMEDEDCMRSYGNDCAALLECSRGEPNRWPKCLPGFVNWGAIGRCLRKCDEGSCPAGHSCDSSMGPPACVPQD